MTEKLKVLFVCAANYSRSKTAEKLVNDEFSDHIEARSAGVTAGPRSMGGHQIEQADVDWADEVVTMEAWQAEFVRDHFHQGLNKGLRSLGIADVFNPGDEGLIELLGGSIKDRVAGKSWRFHGMKEDAPVDLSYLTAQCDEE